MKKIISLMISVFLAFAVFGLSASARVLGDVDGSGKTNSLDALSILKYSVGITDTINEKVADVNCDGKINSSDALVVLNIAVGKYKNPVNVEYKETAIDPILKTGKFTLSTKVDVEGTMTPVTIMVNGNDMCMAMKAQGINVRMLIMGGKAYMIIPDMKIYLELSEKETGDLNFGNFVFADNQKYLGSKYVTENKNTYTVDSYKSEDGSTNDYYFLNGKWKKIVSKDSTGTTEQEITDFKSGIDSSWFSIKDLIKIDADKL